MAKNTVGGLEHLLEDLVRRAVRDAIAQAGISGGGAAISSAPAAAASVSSSGSSSLPLVNRAVSRVLQPTGQSEIMAAVLQSASGFAGRCALFVRRGEGFSFWRGEGFTAETVSDLKSLSAPAGQPGAFKEAAENLVGVSTVRNAEALPSAMVTALAGAADDALFLFPIVVHVVQGRAVATLYADAGSAAGSVEASALEILARVTGLSLETAAGRAAASAAHPVMAQAEASAPAEAPMPESPPPEVAAPPPPPPLPAAPESVAVPAIPAPPDPESLPDSDRDSHKKAYRSARVAVQDLLAYPQNQERIAEGRRNNTLYRLLKEEIDKNRETYQKRYGQTAARSYDYLHFELVTKLAENNPEVLGPDYPGEITG
jgi:hypothetical protein